MGFWGGWKVIGVLACSSVLICLFIFWQTGELPRHGDPSTPESKLTTSPNRSKREVSGKWEECLSTYGGIEVDYVNGSTTSFTFDLCDVFDCKGANSSWRGNDVWVRWDYAVSTHCEWGRQPFDSWCRNWNQVRGYTGENWVAP